MRQLVILCRATARGRRSRRPRAAAERARRGSGVRGEAEILVDGHLQVQRRALREIAEARANVQGVVEDVMALHLRHARGGRDEAREDAHGGRLAGAVGTEEADDLAAAHLEADIVERTERAVTLGQPVRVNHHVGGHPSGGSPRGLLCRAPRTVELPCLSAPARLARSLETTTNPLKMAGLPLAGRILNRAESLSTAGRPAPGRGHGPGPSARPGRVLPSSP